MSYYGADAAHSYLQQKAKEKQKKQQEEQKKQQAKLDAIANQKKALAAQQQAQSIAMQNKFAAQQTAQLAQIDGLKAEQAVKIKGIRSIGQAVSSSLNILADQQLRAPSAAVSPRRRRRGAASTAAQVARGSSRNRGPNLSI